MGRQVIHTCDFCGEVTRFLHEGRHFRVIELATAGGTAHLKSEELSMCNKCIDKRPDRSLKAILKSWLKLGK
jgi:hypothetical protein